MSASLVMTLAPAAMTSRRTSRSLVTTATGRRGSSPADLLADDVVGRDANRRVTNAGEPASIGMCTDDVGTVEHHHELGAEAPSQAVDCIEQIGSLLIQRQIGPRQLGDVVAVHQGDEGGHPEQDTRLLNCGSLAAVRGTSIAWRRTGPVATIALSSSASVLATSEIWRSRAIWAAPGDPLGRSAREASSSSRWAVG